MNKKKTKITKKHVYMLARKLTKGIFFLFVFLAVLQTVFIFTEYFNEHPECMSVRQILNSQCFKEEYVWNTMRENPPPDLVHKAEMMNDARSLILWALLYFCLYEMVIFMEDPEEHWIKGLLQKITNIKEKIE